MRAWAAVGMLWLAYLINYVDRQVVFSIYPALQGDLGFSTGQLGLIGSVFLWSYALFLPAAGRLADRVRRDRLIVASLALWSLVTLATGLSRSPAAFLFCRALMGLTEALYFPAAVSALGTLHPGTTRSRAIALHGSAQFLGIALGGWYGGWMADTHGWRVGLLALAAAGMAYAPALAAGLGRLSPTREAQRIAGRPAELLGTWCYGALALAFFVFCLLLWMIYAWLPVLIHERYGLSLADSGFAATAYLQASSAAGMLAGGVIGDRATRRIPAGRFYTAAAGLLLASPFAWALLAADSLALLRPYSAAFGLFAGLMLSNAVAAAYEVVSPGNYGLAAGVLNTVGGLAGGAGVLLAGAAKESIGIPAVMGRGAAAGVVAALLLAAVAFARFGAERQTPAAARAGAET